MVNPVDLSGRPFHFIGIGGIGMSALAYVLAKRNLPVSGSDICLNDIMKRLERQGAQIFSSQVATNLDLYRAATNGSAGVAETEPSGSSMEIIENLLGTDSPAAPEWSLASPAQLPQIICSTAINPNNAEFLAAQALGCPIYHRSDLLSALMRESQGIAIAGTHGKTTTSSMVGFLLLKAGLDPTIVIGGEVGAWEGNAHVGQGSHLVAEADESDGSLVKLSPAIGVITNIELDHPDHYDNLDQVIQIFEQFASQCTALIGSWDCNIIRQTIRPSISYSLDPSLGADYTADPVDYRGDGISAQIWERGKPLGTLTLGLLGRHNLSNALAAIAVGRQVGLEFATIAAILPEFEGARRRFERRGEHHGILFVDDYAHHPSEIQVTLAAARLRANGMASPEGKLVAVFQPHRFSRTQVFLNNFAQSFEDADLVITTDIYSAGEANPGTISGPMLAEAIAQHHPQVSYCATLEQVVEHLKQVLHPGDLVLFLGAGNLNRVIPEVMAYYQNLDSETLIMSLT